MRKRPSIVKIPCLYAVWYPKLRDFQGLGWAEDDADLFSPRMFYTPGPAARLGINVKTVTPIHGEDPIPAPPHIVVKFIPVATVTTEYKQQRIADEVMA